MKVNIIVAMTADGYIGRTGEHLSTEWTNKDDKYLFATYVKAANNMVMGLNTFLTTAKKYPTVFNKSMPVQRLASEGVEELAICGGTQVYTMFMKAGVVDNLYVDVQATVFGTGVALFSESLDHPISLQEVKRIGDNNVLLHYKVVKA